MSRNLWKENSLSESFLSLEEAAEYARLTKHELTQLMIMAQLTAYVDPKDPPKPLSSKQMETIALLDEKMYVKEFSGHDPFVAERMKLHFKKKDIEELLDKLCKVHKVPIEKAKEMTFSIRSLV